MNIDTIMNYVEKTEGCWKWLAYKNPKGYGRVSFKGKQRQAHRVIYEIMVGKIPANLDLDHLCRNTSCVNPKHLEPVTDYVNRMRGFSPPAILARRTACQKGHSYTKENTYFKEGYRLCKTCTNKENSSYRQKHRKRISEMAKWQYNSLTMDERRIKMHFGKTRVGLPSRFAAIQKIEDSK